MASLDRLRWRDHDFSCVKKTISLAVRLKKGVFAAGTLHVASVLASGCDGDRQLEVGPMTSSRRHSLEPMTATADPGDDQVQIDSPNGRSSTTQIIGSGRISTSSSERESKGSVILFQSYFVEQAAERTLNLSRPHARREWGTQREGTGMGA
ncbi:hypothetical protein [Halapricum desulfuricans]|uniref:hypothetical protein n=1 Tax=Halapricum desulfuricans TaxID=2841257 RepID=UPI001E43FFCC|nr:hypothetical protein [Halapricum desulfuricans]